MEKLIMCAVSGYLIGSFSMSIILTKYIFHDDVRCHGSGNAGATNVARTFGWGPGIITFLCDFSKCVIAMYLGKILAGDWGYAVAGMACLLGHCFPVYFGFRGGKAVSTGACVAFLIDWRIFAAVILVFFVTALKTKIVSISSILAAAALSLLSLFMVPQLPVKILGVFTGLLTIVMHIPNIRRLIRGEEEPFKPGSR